MSKLPIDGSLLRQIREAKDSTDAICKLERENSARLQLAAAQNIKDPFKRQEALQRLLNEFGETDYG
jgi:hypothetical protein